MAASELQKAIDRLIAKEPKWKVFLPGGEKGAKPGGVSTGRPSSSQQQGGGSAFNEGDYTAREYWGVRTVTGSDGIFSVQVQPIKSILLDDNSRATFKDPV